MGVIRTWACLSDYITRTDKIRHIGVIGKSQMELSFKNAWKRYSKANIERCLISKSDTEALFWNCSG